ncbi:MAG: hypothetical protein JXA71_17085 [Chitinispirillaceae bacterium]|nr:hypothetical protein [Chitinispirillaceae bacterium]
MLHVRWCGGIMGVILGCGMVSGAVIFSDDFSDCAQSNQNWIPPVPSTTTTVTCGSGVYRIANSSPTYVGMMFHEFSAPKPAVFTASAKISIASGTRSSGIWVCYNKDNNSGYLFQLNPSTPQSLQFNKYRAGAVVDTSFVVQNSAVVSGANVLKISKKNDSITLYCNNVYIATVRDRTPIASGDLTLLVSANSTVTYDDVVVTDQWTPPPPPIHGFRDDFSDNVLTGWLDLSQVNQKQEADGYLKITTTTTGTSFSDVYIPVDRFGLDTFVTQAAVMHRSGNKTSYYGIFFRGTASAQGVVPMAYFSINASKQYDAYIDTIRPVVSSFIRGAAYETTYYLDTIEVVKKRNAPYRMYVNGQLLDSLPAARIPWAIIGAGINVDNGMAVWVDFFQHSADRNYSPVVTRGTVRRQLVPAAFKPYASEHLFDPMGRVIRMNAINARSNAIVPGYYITPEGTSGLIIRKK